MIIESGIIIFLGLLFLGWKLPPRTSLWLLGRPLTVDIVASVMAYVIHWGTFTGVMAAAVAGLMTSAFTALARWLFGYIDRGRYNPGLVRVQIHQQRRPV